MSVCVCVPSVILKCSLVTVDNIFAGVAELSWIYLELAVEGNVKAPPGGHNTCTV